MIDIDYYTKLVFGSNQTLINKFYGTYNFKSLRGFKNFLSNLPNNTEALERLRNRNVPNDTVNSLLEHSTKMALVLENVVEDGFEFLNRMVYPNIDIATLLPELNPDTRGSSDLVDCPCCENTKTKAFIVKIRNENTGTISCNRKNGCNKNTSIFKYIAERQDHVESIETINYLAKQVGIDFSVYVRNREMHREDNGIFQDKDYVCDRDTITNNINAKKKKNNPYGISEFETIKPDFNQTFKKVNLLKVLGDYKIYSEQDKIRIIYQYIKTFTLKETDRKDMEIYLGKRGISRASAKDFGLLKADKINELVNELKEIFGKEDLIKYKILNNKGYWKYSLLTEEGNFIYNDSIVSFMHDVYSDSPTNIEFKFFGDKVKGSSTKAVSMSNSAILNSNYYSNITIDNLKNNDKENKVIWWNEGSLDTKCLSSMGMLSNGLIGAGKHFNKNLGLYKNKTHVICLDEDKAGRESAITLAKKLKMIGVKQIYNASWNEQYGNDMNDLLNGNNLHKITLSLFVFRLNEDTNTYDVSIDRENVKYMNNETIQKAYKEQARAYYEVSRLTGEDISTLYKKVKIKEDSNSNDNALSNIDNNTNIKKI